MDFDAVGFFLALLTPILAFNVAVYAAIYKFQGSIPSILFLSSSLLLLAPLFLLDHVCVCVCVFCMREKVLLGVIRARGAHLQ